MLYRYWTNFNKKRATSGNYEVLLQGAEGYWWFETTIDPKYLEEMTLKHRNRFLYQMEDFYKHADD